MAERPYDAAVVGGGIVGATAALALGRGGRRVVLIDRERPSAVRGRLGFDVRTVALTPASLAFLDVATPAAPIRRMRVWEELGTARIDFDAASVGLDALASVVEVSALCEALWDACDGTADLDVCRGAVSGLVQGADTLTVVVGERKIPAKLVIAADGAESRVRQLAGVEVLDRGNHDAAIATVVRSARPHRDEALQRFGAHGPLAFLPLPDPHCTAVIWSQDRAASERVGVLDDDAFAQALCTASEGVLGRFEEVDRRYAFPLSQRVVRDFHPMSRLLIVGDAARTIHPLAGQGVNLGIEDAARIAHVAEGAVDLGGANLWGGFARRRRARAEAMVALMTALRGSYGYGGPVGRWLRNVGIRGIDATPAVKRMLIREAMGEGFLGRAL